MPNSIFLLFLIMIFFFFVIFLCFIILFIFRVINLWFFYEFFLSSLIFLFLLWLIFVLSILLSLIFSLNTFFTPLFYFFILLLLIILLFGLIFLFGLFFVILFKLWIFSMSIIFNKLPSLRCFLLSFYLLFSYGSCNWQLWCLYSRGLFLCFQNLFDLWRMLHNNVLYLFLLLFIRGEFLWF